MDNRLVEIKDGSNNTIATYTYDPFGRRIKKQTGAGVTYYLYSDEGLIGEYDAAGNELKTYGYKPDSTWTTDPLFCHSRENGNPEFYFYQNDHLGTPQKMTNISGAVVWSATYDAFGKAIVDASSTIMNNLRFPGQYFDGETNLYYNWNRFYDSIIGRYMITDPIGFAGGDENLFRYVLNNPLRWIDPDGLSTFICRRPLKKWKKERGTAFHEYPCVVNPTTGKKTCSSTTPKGFFLLFPGRPTTPEDGDVYDPKKCREVEPDNICMDSCMEKNMSSSSRPQYGYPGPGTDCKEYSRDLVENCRKQCFLMNDYRKGLDE